MTRRRFRKQAVSPSLFPFLAVLVCTMGALIVLLVLVVQQARVNASDIAQQRVAASKQERKKHEDQRLLLEDLQWQREVFDQQREELTKQLSDHRLELSHLEDHIRRLEAEWKTLRAQAAEIQTIENQESADTKQRRTELDRLRHEIELARQRLEEAQEEAAARPQTFAIIPYNGANGTKRRPIYIECTEHGVIIQPEGVVLAPRDFEGPLGPGNPLDASLRTIREYWARQGSFAKNGEPYPLLIVRPDGTLAYSYARQALKAWDDEFGYELIDADMQLEYPAIDPGLRELLNDTIKQARQRQEILIAAMPSQFGGRSSGGGLVAAPSQGGFRPVGGGGFDSQFGSPNQGGLGKSRQQNGDRTFRGSNPSSQAGSSNAAANSQHDGQQHPTTRETHDGGTVAGGTVAGEKSQPSAKSQPGAKSQSGANGPAGKTSGSGRPTANTRGGASGQAAGAGALAGQRGSNWALPKAAANATAYQIPVRVVCQADRLVILPSPKETAKPLDIPAAGALTKSIDQFVQGLWQQIDQWDEPPIGGYWQPVLEVYVYPGAEDRFFELQSLLHDSGIQVQRQAQ